MPTLVSEENFFGCLSVLKYESKIMKSQILPIVRYFIANVKLSYNQLTPWIKRTIFSYSSSTELFKLNLLNKESSKLIKD